MSTVNIIQLAKSVEMFYLSNNQNQMIIVPLYAPINDTLPIFLVKQKTYELTLKYALSTIYLHLSNFQKITTTGNKVYTTSTVNGRNFILKYLQHDDFHKYNTSYNRIGHISLL